jgi:PBP1b-binding outer membrane lipoprotein LpoB
MKIFFGNIPHKVLHATGMAAIAALLMTGCVNVQPPSEQMAVSKAAVSNANTAGAEEFAPLLLKSATDKMAGAELAMTQQKYDMARVLAEQAQVEAQLAAATAHRVRAQKAADTVQEDSRILRKEIERKTN